MKGRMTNTPKTNRATHGYANGGVISDKNRNGSPSKVYPGAHYPKGGSPNVKKEAQGKTSVKFTTSGGPVEGIHATPRLDRPGRRRGGRVGADMAPLSTAANAKGD